MNPKNLFVAGGILLLGVLAYLYNTFFTTPLQVEQAPVTTVAPLVDPLPVAQDNESVELSVAPITNTADAVAALEGFDGDALDAQLDTTLAEIDSSFE
jgi:hypothetical protein